MPPAILTGTQIRKRRIAQRVYAIEGERKREKLAGKRTEQQKSMGKRKRIGSKIEI